MSLKLSNRQIKNYYFLNRLLLKMQENSINSKKTVTQIFHQDFILFLNLLKTHNIIDSYKLKYSKNKPNKTIEINLNENFSFTYYAELNILTLIELKALNISTKTTIFLHTDQGLMSLTQCITKNITNSSIVFEIKKNRVE
jgi:hypothetical protein